MPFHFFTDYDSLGLQLQKTTNVGEGFIDTNGHAGAFGLIEYSRGENPMNVYPAIHLGDTYRSKSDTIEPYAYAVCNGIIAVVPVKNSNLVNIILKPTEHHKLAIPKVKYYIYRGVLRDSIFNDPLNIPANQQSLADFPAASDSIVYKLGTSGNGDYDRNNLLEFLYNNRADNSTDPLSSKILMYDQLKADTSNPYLDSLFVKKPGDEYGTNIEVKGGWVIGRFPSKKNNTAGTRLDRYTVIPTSDTNFWYSFLNVFGFDIILDSLDYNPSLDLVKRNIRSSGPFKSEFRNFNLLQINPAPLSNVPLDTTNKNRLFAQRASMEDALNYMDPAVFWGSFYRMYTGDSNEGYEYSLNVRKHDSPNGFKSLDPILKVEAPNYASITGTDIYEIVLKGPTSGVANFANKNRVYFDIRNRYNDSYNLYNDNCYNETPSDPNTVLDYKKNILYTIEDGQTPTGDSRTLLARNYYNQQLPWLIFDMVSSNADDPLSCDTGPIVYFPVADKFGNGILSFDYNLTLSFPTVSNPLIEQYSVFYLHDSQWKDGTVLPRLLLSTDNTSDNYAPSKLKYLHYQDGEHSTNAVKIRVNTINRSTGVRVVVAGYHRMAFIKHTTKLYHPAATEADFKLPTHLPSSLRAVSIPRPVEFLDCTFNMKMILPFGNVAAGSLQNNVAEENRYADITRATGWDMTGQAGVSKAASGDMVFYINGKYHRQGMNGPRLSTFANKNFWLSISSTPVENTGETFLQTLAKKDSASILRRTADTNTETLSMMVSGTFGDNTTEQLNFFSYVKIPVSDWNTIKSFYDPKVLYDVNTNNVIFSRFHLCFKQLPNDCGLPNKYEYWLKGFVVRQVGTTNEYVVDEYTHQFTDLTNYNSFTTFGSKDIPPNFLQVSGRPANFTRSGTTSVISKISSDVYLIRGMALTYDQYYNLCQAANNDLKKVYSSSSNKGLGDILADNTIGLNTIVYDGNILQAIPPKFMFLRNQEVMFLLNCKPADHNAFQRSNAKPDHRLAALFLTPLTGENANLVEKYVIAHEYGHILGLADRYGYRASMSASDALLVDSNSGTGIPLYIAGDTVYNNDYRWYFNLMSLAQAVPASPFTGIPFGSESNFITKYDTIFTPSGTPGNFGYYPSFSIFLSPEQWKHIESNPVPVPESDFFGQQYVFLFPSSVASNISFVGNSATDGSGADISDANVSVNTGVMATRASTGIVPLGRMTYKDENIIMASVRTQDELTRGGFYSASVLPVTTPVVDLSGAAEAYLAIETKIRTLGIGGGVAAGNGLAVWNYVPPPGLISEQVSTSPSGRVRVKYKQHPNRVTLIRIISRGN
jgi:hypothetical protein